MPSFSIEITLDPGGVRAVRIYGKSWEQHHAYALLQRLSPLIEQLDALAKDELTPAQPKEKVQ